MSDILEEDDTRFKYNLIDMRDVDCEHFLRSERPEEVILAILCNYHKKGVTLFVKDVLHRLRDLVKDEALLCKYIRQVEILSFLRDFQEEVCKEVENMAIIYDLEKDVRFRQGKEKGKEEGKEEGLHEGLAKGKEKGLHEGLEKGLHEGLEKGLLKGLELALKIKFGDEGLLAMDRLKTIKNIDLLEQVQGYILKASSVNELMRFINKGNN